MRSPLPRPLHCPACGVTPAGAELSATARECECCTRYRTLVANARHRRVHVRTPLLALSRSEFARWAAGTERVCYACGIPERLVERLGLLTQVGHRLRRLGIDRLDNGGDYTLDNIAWCCFPCNRVKSSTFTAAEMRETIGPRVAAVWRARLTASGVEDDWLAGKRRAA